MKSRFIHIIIVFLLAFQNASAIEQTYSDLCDELDSNTEIVDIVTSDLSSSVDDHCSHSSSTIVFISPLNISSSVQFSTNYFVNAINLHHSISIQPPIPFPIVLYG